MASTINTNISSLNAQRNLSASSGSLTTSMQRLSSGLRVNSAKDDAAGLAIAERMQHQVRGMNVAIRNANGGISLAAPPNAYTGDVALSYFVAGTGTKLRTHMCNAYRAPSLYERFGTSFFGGGFSPYCDPRLTPGRALRSQNRQSQPYDRIPMQPGYRSDA